MSQGIYLFCLAPKDSSIEIEGTGIDGVYPLSAKTIGDVIAILSEVSLEDFCGQEARERLANLSWVAPRALRHEEVIMAVMREASVLPARFGSVFSSQEALASLLLRHRDALAKFFVDTAGQKEWTLKAYVDMPQARLNVQAMHMAAEKEHLAALSPGLRYFQEQKIKAAMNHEVASWLKGLADEIVTSIKGLSLAISECRLVSTELTGKADEMFFHVAILVPDALAELLLQHTAKWNKRHESLGVYCESSGPLPPYHFTPKLDMQE